MSLKRAAILSHILAVILLLVHVFLPHHHHNDIICIEETSHCESHEEPENHPEEDSNHEHNHCQTSQCFINQLVVVPVGQKENNLRHIAPQLFHNIHFLLRNKFQSGDIIFYAGFIDTSQIFIPFHTFLYYYSSLGFRGPPEITTS